MTYFDGCRISRRYYGFVHDRFIHWNHHDQFRPKSGSGDQNKQTVPSVETVGCTATELIAFNITLYSWTMFFFPVGPYIVQFWSWWRQYKSTFDYGQTPSLTNPVYRYFDSSRDWKDETGEEKRYKNNNLLWIPFPVLIVKWNLSWILFTE